MHASTFDNRPSVCWKSLKDDVTLIGYFETPTDSQPLSGLPGSSFSPSRPARRFSSVTVLVGAHDHVSQVSSPALRAEYDLMRDDYVRGMQRSLEVLAAPRMLR